MIMWEELLQTPAGFVVLVIAGGAENAKHAKRTVQKATTTPQYRPKIAPKQWNRKTN